jgi:hypothetical protein
MVAGRIASLTGWWSIVSVGTEPAADLISVLTRGSRGRRAASVDFVVLYLTNSTLARLRGT